MTGSVILPFKTLIMNLLTLSAAFGILKLIFQDGRLEGVLGYTSQGALESSQPILLFAIAFGLSTDYGVFLLTRIKEARDSGLSNDEAVAVGLQRTGRIVTAAAILFCIAIGAFVTSEMIFIKQLGLGHGAGRADRRHDRARAARAVADEAARRLELVGAAAAGAPAPADRAVGGAAGLTRLRRTASTPTPHSSPPAPGGGTAWAPEHWFVARGPNGGFLAALAARAAELAAGRPLRSLALHFLAAPAVGPLDVAATVEREGRSYSVVSAAHRARTARPSRSPSRRWASCRRPAPAWAVGAMPAARPAGRRSTPPAAVAATCPPSSATTTRARRWTARRRPAAGSARARRARSTRRSWRRCATPGRLRPSPSSAASSRRRRST